MKTFYLRFNKTAMQRGDPKVWSIRTSKGCLHAKKVVLEVPVETVFKPDSKQNPRAFLKGKGNGFWVWFGDDDEPSLLIAEYPAVGWDNEPMLK